MQVSCRHGTNGRRCNVAKRNVRINAVHRETVDIEKLVSGLLLLLEELSASAGTDGAGDTPDTGKADR
jgi:hypothetical protein